MLEKSIEKKAIKKLRRLPGSWWPDKYDAGSIRGLPDRIGCVNGIMCAIEFKRTKEEAAKLRGRIVLQKYILDEIKKAGGYTAVCWPENWDLVYNELLAFCGVKEI